MLSPSIIVDGITWKIPVKSLKRKRNFLDKDSTTRTADGGMHRELIGMYRNYDLVFGRVLDLALYENFTYMLEEPVAFHTIQVPPAIPLFTAYFSDITDNLLFLDVQNSALYWENLTVSFIARLPARTP